MRLHPELLNTAGQIADLADILRTAEFVAFDTEFIRETTFFPVVEIIQVATEDDAWLVDARAFSPRRPGTKEEVSEVSAGLRPLFEIFQDPKIIKIGHALQGDQECLATTFGVVAKPSIDTALAASLCGYGDSIGLGNLVKAVMGITLRKGHARTNWSARPLPPQLLDYALADVEYLVQVWKRLREELRTLGREDWAFELSAKWEDESLYRPDPEGIAEKLASGGRMDRKGYGALLELVRWREERVRQLNLPRRWVADDNVLLDLARVRPKDVNHLATFRGLNKGELKNCGEAILEAIRRGASRADVEAPHRPRTRSPSVSESQVLDLLKCYVGMLADEHRIAVRHLVSSHQMLPLLESRAETVEDLVRTELLSGPAARLIGSEVIALLKGERALSVHGDRIRVVPVEPAVRA